MNQISYEICMILVTANPHEYCDKSELHKWQIQMKMIANTHELTFIY